MSDRYELSYGEVLRQLREFHGYTQKDISNYLNITSQDTLITKITSARLTLKCCTKLPDFTAKP